MKDIFGWKRSAAWLVIGSTLFLTLGCFKLESPYSSSQASKAEPAVTSSGGTLKVLTSFSMESTIQRITCSGLPWQVMNVPGNNGFSLARESLEATNARSDKYAFMNSVLTQRMAFDVATQALNREVAQDSNTRCFYRYVNFTKNPAQLTDAELTQAVKWLVWKLHMRNADGTQVGIAKKLLTRVYGATGDVREAWRLYAVALMQSLAFSMY
jgi:hypothetical protein